MYTRALKSKDIDIIVDYEELAKMKEDYGVFKNDRLKKYEIKTGEFDIDIYLPHYSDLGIDVEKIAGLAVSREGFIVPPMEILLMLKLCAWRERKASAKGRKDELDILGLAVSPEFDWDKYKNFISEFALNPYNHDLIAFLKRVRGVSELGINEQKMSKIRRSILGKLGENF